MSRQWGHEPDVVAVRVLLVAGVGLVLGILAVLAVALGTRAVATPRRDPAPAPLSSRQEQNLSSSGHWMMRGDGPRLSERQRRLLESAEGPGGRRRIPVEEAAAQLLAAGLTIETRPPAEPPPPAEPGGGP